MADQIPEIRSTDLRRWLWVYILFAAIDFYKVGGDQSPQYPSFRVLCFTGSLFSGLVILARFRSKRHFPALQSVLWAWILFALIGIAAYFINVEITSGTAQLLQVAQFIAPVLLFGLSLLVSKPLAATGVTLYDIRHMIVTASVGNIVVQLLYGLSSSGASGLRWHLNSQGACILAMVGLCALLPQCSASLPVWGLLVYALLALTISLTRSAFVAVAFVLVWLLALAIRHPRQLSLSSLRKTIAVFASIFILAPLAYVVLDASNPALFSAWSARLSKEALGSEGNQSTIAVRLAQAEAEYRQIAQHDETLALGVGFGTKGEVVDPDKPYAVAGKTHLYWLSIWDLTWSYLFFVSGVIGGAIGLYAYLRILASVVQRAWHGTTFAKPEAMWNVLFPSVAFMFILAYGLGATVFIWRFLSLMLGLVGGLSLCHGMGSHGNGTGRPRLG